MLRPDQGRADHRLYHRRQGDHRSRPSLFPGRPRRSWRRSGWWTSSWDDVAPGNIRAGFVIRADEHPGLLAKVAAAVSELGGNIVKAEVATSADQKARIRLGLGIRDIEHLEAIVKEISKIEGIPSVERT